MLFRSPYLRRKIHAGRVFKQPVTFLFPPPTSYGPVFPQWEKLTTAILYSKYTAIVQGSAVLRGKITVTMQL